MKVFYKIFVSYISYFEPITLHLLFLDQRQLRVVRRTFLEQFFEFVSPFKCLHICDTEIIWLKCLFVTNIYQQNGV